MTTIPRTLSVRHVEVQRISDIDIIAQRFKAQIFLQLAFENGANDNDLTKDSAEFPIDEVTKKPTFRPSALWFLDQVDFNNALEFTKLDSKVFADGDDLLFSMRFEGTFEEEMELESFPFDSQDLKISLAFNVRTTGKTPLVFSVPKPEENKTFYAGINQGGFVGYKIWTLDRNVDVTATTTGVSKDREFPALNVTMVVHRQPRFMLLNLALPVVAFVPMSMLQFALPYTNIGGRLGISLTIVLTATAHKLSMTNLVPAVSYLTFLDKYTLVSLALIALICFQGGLIGGLEISYCNRMAVFDTRNTTYMFATPDDFTRFPQLINYRDEECWASFARSRMGQSATPWNKFDVLDALFLYSDLCCWLLLNCWAFYRGRYATTLSKHQREMSRARRQEQRRQAKEAAEAAAAPKKQESSFAGAVVSPWQERVAAQERSSLRAPEGRQHRRSIHAPREDAADMALLRSESMRKTKKKAPQAIAEYSMETLNEAV